MSSRQQPGIWAGRGEITAEETSLVWRPSPNVAYHAPRGLQLRLREWRGLRTRLITPADGFYSFDSGGRIGPGSFHYDAPCGGLAVLRADGLVLEDRQMYDTASLYLQKLRSSKTWLKRQFNGPLDFKISQPMRVATGTRTAVPGFYQGREPGVAEMMRLGREEALRQGVSDPTRDEVTSFALFVLAKEDPMTFDEQAQAKIPFVVRSAMLDSDIATMDVTNEELQMVTDRFADLVEPHLDDELFEFDKWLDGPKNSLVRQIANRRNAPGGQLDQKRVTAALADLGWRSLLLSAKCVEVQMQCVAADLPEPLLGDDLRRFELSYYRQPCFGSLSLCMLAERFRFIRVGLNHLMDSPTDPERIGVVQRMLHLYSVAVSQRRDLDRQRKRLSADAGQRRTLGTGKRHNGRGMECI